MERGSVQLRKFSEAIATVLQAQHVPAEFAAAMLSIFPQAGYVGVASVGGGSAAEPELLEYYNLVDSEQRLATAAYPSGTRSVAREVVAGNDSRYYDESVHRDKTENLDFARLLEQHECASIIAVPLRCHSQSGGGSAATHCSYCSRSIGAAGRPLGCLTIGVRRNVNFPIGEYLTKMTLLAGYLGPRLLAPAQHRAPAAAISPASAAAAASAALAQHQNALMGMALSSSFYAPASAPPPAPLSGLAAAAAARRSLEGAPLGSGWASNICPPAMPSTSSARMSLDSSLSQQHRFGSAERMHVPPPPLLSPPPEATAYALPCHSLDTRPDMPQYHAVGAAQQSWGMPLEALPQHDARHSMDATRLIARYGGTGTRFSLDSQASSYSSSGRCESSDPHQRPSAQQRFSLLPLANSEVPGRQPLEALQEGGPFPGMAASAGWSAGYGTQSSMGMSYGEGGVGPQLPEQSNGYDNMELLKAMHVLNNHMGGSNGRLWSSTTR